MKTKASELEQACALHGMIPNPDYRRGKLPKNTQPRVTNAQFSMLMRLAEAKLDTKPSGSREGAGWERTVSGLTRLGLAIGRFNGTRFVELTAAGKQWLFQRGAL